MMYRKMLLACLAVILTLNLSMGQIQKSQVPLRYSVLKEAILEVYDPPYDAISSYTSPSEVNYASPEEVILAEHAANSQEWINELYLKEDSLMAKVKPSDLRKKNASNKQENYFRLIHKLTFDHNGFPTAIIKTRFYMDGKPSFLSYIILQKRNNRWYKWSSGELEEVKNVVMQLKSGVLLQLLQGQNTGDVLINEMIRETRSTENTLDFAKTYNLILMWFENGRLNDLHKIRDPFILN